MQHILEKIERLTAELRALSPMKPEYQANLDKKLRLEFNYNSNHLEGNTLTYGETELLLIFDGTRGTHTAREYEEVKAHDLAFELIKQWAADKERPLMEANIKELNEIILVRAFWKDAQTESGQQTRRLINIGNYKEFPNSVLLANGEMFNYASPIDTPIRMGELMEWYRKEEEKNELHPVALAALFHYKFVCIHPFDDGNGRISRLLMNFVLMKNNLPPIVIKSADKQKYLAALNDADTGNINSFIEYIATQLIWSLELSIQAAIDGKVEEDDDIDKEIVIWKKQVTANAMQHRSDDLICELYVKNIKEILMQFDIRHKQFYDLFYTVSSTAYLNCKSSSVKGSIEAISTEIHTIAPKPKHLWETSSEIIPKDTFIEIFIEVRLQGFKHCETGTFNVVSILKFQFNPYEYIMIYTNALNKQLEKKYGEFLDTDERKQIISDSIKAVFAEIKEKSEKGK